MANTGIVESADAPEYGNIVRSDVKIEQVTLAQPISGSNRCSQPSSASATGVERLVLQIQWWNRSGGIAAYFTKRVTNASAVSATSRQPLSMTSPCPRLGISMISVTAGLRFCFL
jgi:hypothetical protein